MRGLNKILLYKKVDLFKPNSVIMCLIQRELKPYSEKRNVTREEAPPQISNFESIPLANKKGKI